MDCQFMHLLMDSWPGDIYSVSTSIALCLQFDIYKRLVPQVAQQAHIMIYQRAKDRTLLLQTDTPL